MDIYHCHDWCFFSLFLGFEFRDSEEFGGFLFANANAETAGWGVSGIGSIYSSNLAMWRRKGVWRGLGIDTPAMGGRLYLDRCQVLGRAFCLTLRGRVDFNGGSGVWDGEGVRVYAMVCCFDLGCSMYGAHVGWLEVR
jgi:hypothetical protein